MALWNDVQAGVDGVLRPEWSIVHGRAVPETADINLTNGGVRLDATYLYADMADSTTLAQNYTDWCVAKVIRCYLNAATRIIRHRGGEIRSFDGDRVMGIFIGDNKNTAAVRAALNINWAVKKVINPALKAKWDDFTWSMDHGVGIDTGEAMLVRGGVRGSNDIVSIGHAPNIAAKLSEFRGLASLYVSEATYDDMGNEVKYTEDGRSNMWSGMGYKTFGGKSIRVFGSGYWWGS